MQTLQKSIVLLLVLFILIFTGCRKETVQPVEIRWWHINSEQPSQDALEEVAQDFMDLNPHVNVEVIMLDNIEFKPKLKLQFAGQDPPEIFHSWGGGGMAEQVEAGYLKDLTPWIESDQWETEINEAAKDLYSYKGKRYGFPQDLGAVGFWYNQELLKQAGYDDFPTDWDAFLTMLDDLKQNNITPLALGFADRWPVMYYWVYLTIRIGGSDIYQKILQGEELFDNPAMVKAGEMMQVLYNGNYLQSTSIGDDFVTQSRYVGDGICAMQLMGQWALAVQSQSAEKKDALNEQMRFAPFPSIEGTSGSIYDAMGGGNGFVIGREAPDEAVELLNFFNKTENLQKYFNAFPAVPTSDNVKIQSSALNMVKDYVSEAEHYTLYPDQMFPEKMGVLLNELSARVMLGEISSQEACRQLDQLWLEENES